MGHDGADFAITPGLLLSRPLSSESEVYARAVVVIEARWVLRPGCPSPALPSGVGLWAWASLCGLVGLTQAQTWGKKSSPISASSQGPTLTGSAVQALESWGCSKATSLAEEKMVLFSLLI